VNLSERKQVVCNLLQNNKYRWIKRFAIRPVIDDYLACFNTFFMTRIYYKRRFQSVIDFFSVPRSLRDIEYLLESMSRQAQNEIYSFIHTAIDRHFLVVTDFSEKKKCVEIAKQMAGNGVEINIVYMIFSLNCNLRCPHCIILKNHDRDGYPVMTKAEIENYIDYFCLNYGKSKIDPDMIFYGGEPLLYPALIKHSVLYSKKKEKELAFYGRFKYSIITNGTIIDDDFLKFARDHNIAMIISLDGFAKQHDKFRIDKNGRGSFKRAIEFADRAIEKELKVTFSVTPTSSCLPTLPRFFAWLRKRFDGRSIGMNRLYYNRTRYTRLKYEYYQQMERLFFYCATHDIAEGILMKRWDVFQTCTPFPRYCGGVGNQVVFLPGGLAGPCHGFCDTCYKGRKKNFINIPYGKLLKDHVLWQRWDRARAYDIPGCINQCDIFSLCGGGCAYQAYMLNHSIHGCDKDFCRLMESVFKIYLLNEFNDKRKQTSSDFY